MTTVAPFSSVSPFQIIVNGRGEAVKIGQIVLDDLINNFWVYLKVAVHKNVADRAGLDQ